MVRDLIGPTAAMANVCVSLEADASTLGSDEEMSSFLKEYGMTETGLSKVIRHSTELLGMHTFYTVGPKETHAWDLRLGSTAPQAAGVIHSDFERGFIRAEVIGYTVRQGCGLSSPWGPPVRHAVRIAFATTARVLRRRDVT